MLGYITLGSNDIEASKNFYSNLVAVIGGKELMKFSETFIIYGVSMDKTAIAITTPYDGAAAGGGNGNMAAIVVNDRALVDSLHAKALELGGTCDGPPGLRGGEGPMAFYAAYFRDLDGNKLCAYKMGPAS